MWSADKIAKMAGGRLDQPDAKRKITGFSIDSRTIKQDEFFVAIRGAQTDGHFYLEEAFRRGASGALVERLPVLSQAGFCNLIVVENSLAALQRLASEHRDLFNIPLVAITGSFGKTSVKELCHTILAKKFKAYRSPGNLNSETGLPLALLAMPQSTQIGIFELGLQHPGDIKALCKILKPTLGVITGIGHAHLEHFASLEALADEKWALAQNILEQGNLLVLNCDSQPVFERALLINSSQAKKIIKYSIFNNHAEIRAAAINDTNLNGLEFKITTPDESFSVRSPLLGRAHVYSILAAAGVAFSLDIPSAQIAQGIADAKPAPRRMELKESKRFGKIIDDSYNANPHSMREAIYALGRFEGEHRKVLVLGDMLELGRSSEALHLALADEIDKSDIDFLITIGSLSAKLAEALSQKSSWNLDRRAVHCRSHAEILDFLIGSLPNDKNLILVKGSRGMELDILVGRLVGSV